MSFLTRWFSSVMRFFRTTPKRYTITGAVLIVLAIVGLNFFRNRAPAQAEIMEGPPHVRLASVASLSSQTTALPVTGIVSSLQQATILAQSSGEVTRVYRKLGDSVSAGATIALFENASQQAAVTQAQGALEAAQAALAKATGATAQNSSITSSSAVTSVQNARTTIATALATLYAALDDAVHAKADQQFSNPHSPGPILNFQTSDSQMRINVQNERAGLDALIDGVRDRAVAFGANTDVDMTVQVATRDAGQVGLFLNDLLAASVKGMPNDTVSASTLSSYQSSVSTARSSVVAALSTLSSAKSSYDSAVSQAKVAANSAGSGSENDIASAQASVKQAQGSLAAAQANLAKTVIRSPISGTIVNLSLKQGDYANSSAQVAIVSNAGALEVVTHVTADDARTLRIGGKAEIEGGVEGVITSIAPALDPSTNKIEVHVGLPGNTSALTDGESVVVNLDRSQGGKAQKPGNSQITIPIVALKISPEGPIVFSLTASSTLESRKVVLGSILGDTVVVQSGLSPEMTIVSDARGRSEGETVVVDAQ